MPLITDFPLLGLMRAKLELISFRESRRSPQFYDEGLLREPTSFQWGLGLSNKGSGTTRYDPQWPLMPLAFLLVYERCIIHHDDAPLGQFKD